MLREYLNNLTKYFSFQQMLGLMEGTPNKDVLVFLKEIIFKFLVEILYLSTIILAIIRVTGLLIKKICRRFSPASFRLSGPML